MPVGAREGRLHERFGDLEPKRRADDPGAQAEHVHVVVLHGLMCCVGVVTDRGANAWELAGRDRYTGPAATDDDPAIGPMVVQRDGDRFGCVGIVAGGG